MSYGLVGIRKAGDELRSRSSNIHVEMLILTDHSGSLISQICNRIPF